MYFFADIKNMIDIDLLRRLSDAMKYNQCDTGLICQQMCNTEIYDNNSAVERQKTRMLLKKAEKWKKNVMFRKKSLEKKWLGTNEAIKTL